LRTDHFEQAAALRRSEGAWRNADESEVFCLS
jgi:hypothetical protein